MLALINDFYKSQSPEGPAERCLKPFPVLQVLFQNIIVNVGLQID